MKLILIYGPPTAGKLTVAKELSSITGIKVFHNHMTIDLAEELFDWGTPGFQAVVDTVRFAVFEEAAKADVDLIFTLVYCAPFDVLYVDRIVRAIETNGGEVCFVRLQCALEALKERVVSPERKQFGKISSVEKLELVMSRGDLLSAAPHDGVDIDTRLTTPSAAAQSIAERFGLCAISEG